MTDATPRADFTTVALWAVNMALPLNGLEAWISKVDEKLAEAAAAGAKILVMPEYASEHWLGFGPELALTDEVDWMAEQGEQALRLLAPVVAKRDIALLAGSWPARAPGRDPDGPPHVNRAHLLLPDGRVVAQDKLCLTPSEKDSDGWNLNVGTDVRITEWAGLRMATLICLDIELPALSAKLARREPGLDLLLVPSMTGKQSGYSRVFGCAKARAVELQTAVAAVGCVGSVAPDNARPNHSGASVFLPCEEAFGFTGLFAQVPASDSAEGDGPMLIARDVPVGQIRAIRIGGGAEVWPGAWTADGVEIVETVET